MMVEVEVYFNFRSPYCYLASKWFFALSEEFRVDLRWKPFGGWQGRSAPDRAAYKIPLVRQDVSRYAKFWGIPFSPPPVQTDPTAAACGSFLAERAGVLEPYVKKVMHNEWGEGRDIGDIALLHEIAASLGLDRQEFTAALDDPGNRERLERNWQDAEHKGVFGVPTFVVGNEIFWGNDRSEFLRRYLKDLGLAIQHND